MTSVAYRLSVDYENNSDWWENGGQKLWELLNPHDPYKWNCYVTKSVLDGFMKRAEKIKGWSDGPAYAPHPILVQPLSQEEWNNIHYEVEP